MKNSKLWILLAVIGVVAIYFYGKAKGWFATAGSFSSLTPTQQNNYIAAVAAASKVDSSQFQ